MTEGPSGRPGGRPMLATAGRRDMSWKECREVGVTPDIRLQRLVSARVSGSRRLAKDG